MDYAVEEADNLKHGHVDTEHLLLGLIRDQDGIAGKVLAGLGVELMRTREEVLRVRGADSGEQNEPELTRNLWIFIGAVRSKALTDIAQAQAREVPGIVHKLIDEFLDRQSSD